MPHPEHIFIIKGRKKEVEARETRSRGGGERRIEGGRQERHIEEGQERHIEGGGKRDFFFLELKLLLKQYTGVYTITLFRIFPTTSFMDR